MALTPKRSKKPGTQAAVAQATTARFWSVYQHVPDFLFVDDHSAILLEEAQKRLIWAHRLYSPARPFGEIVDSFEAALAEVDLEEAKLQERRRRANERRELHRGRQKLKAIKHVGKQQQLEESKRLKRRTREQRIADLQKALESQ